MGCATSSPVGLPRPASEPPSSQSSVFGRPAAKADAPVQFHSDYILGRKLGVGSFASVYSARRVDGGGDFAVKVVGPQPGDAEGQRSGSKRQRAIEREVAVSRALPRSPNLVEFFSFYGGEGLSYFVMERCDMDLVRYLDGAPLLTEVALKPVFTDMASAIATCHSAGVVHRDVKCENFVVAKRPGGRGFSVKLCDFGLASRISAPSATELTGICGTPVYMAPEMLRGEAYGASVDVWALGVLVYVLLLGGWPYMPPAPTAEEVKTAIRLGTPAPDFCSQAGLPELSADCAEWVASLLCRDPANRPSAAQALGAACFRRRWSSAAPPGTERRVVALRRAVVAARGPSELGRKGPKRQVSEALTSASGDGPSPLLAVRRQVSESLTSVSGDIPSPP